MSKYSQMQTQLRKEIDSVRDSEGVVHTDDMIRLGKDPKTLLHRYFEWDNEKAGHKWRTEQARNLLQVFNLHRVEDGRRITVPAYVSLPADRNRPGGGYRLMEDVLQNESLREELIRSAYQELQRWEAKYQHLNEFAEVFEAVNQVANLVESEQTPVR